MIEKFVLDLEDNAKENPQTKFHMKIISVSTEIILVHCEFSY